VPVELMDFPKNSDVGILGEVERIIRIAGHSDQQSVHSVTGQSVQFALSLAVSFTTSFDKLGFGHGLVAESQAQSPTGMRLAHLPF